MDERERVLCVTEYRCR